MKQFVFRYWLGVYALAGCAKTASPVPATLEGTWDFATGNTVTGPKNGTAPTTISMPFVPGGIAVPGGLTVTYGPDGTYTSRSGYSLRVLDRSQHRHLRG